MKKVTVFFDFESVWGVPTIDNYDVKSTTVKILRILKKYNVSATFCICGVIAHKFPSLIKSVYSSGHEIAVHGYEHEDFSKLSSAKINSVLSKSEIAIKKAIGKLPIGFRAPYLYNPNFYDKKLYKVLEKRGYKWASNRQITRLEEVFLKVTPLWMSWLALPIFNSKLILKDLLSNKKVSILKNMIWLLNNRQVFWRKKILEIPLQSTMDCFLIGLPNIDVDSSTKIIDRSVKILKSQFIQSKGEYNLNFHDWIIGTKNRLIILDKILKYLSRQPNIEFVLAKELTKK